MTWNFSALLFCPYHVYCVLIIHWTRGGQRTRTLRGLQISETRNHGGRDVM